MAWISGAIAAAGAIGGSLINKKSAKDTNQQAADLSSTAATRRVADLKAAGLNPMLGYNGEAATPSLKTPEFDIGAGSKAVEGYTSGMYRKQLALQNAKTAAETENTLSQNELIKAETAYRQSETLNSQFSATGMALSNREVEARTDKIRKEIESITSDTFGKDLDNDQKQLLRPLLWEYQQLQNERERLQIPRERNEAAREGDWFKRYVSPYIKDVGGISNMLPGISFFRGLPSSAASADRFDTRKEWRVDKATGEIKNPDRSMRRKK